MSAALQPVWHEIEKYIDSGISVIPLRDKDEVHGGVVKYAAKTPYSDWKDFQTRIIGKDELFEAMDIKHNTIAVGIVCGKVSGNLEVIDIDVKYKPGVDAELFTAIQTLYPDIFDRLRIHRTPSGGYHLLYRCTEKVQGNQKLAGRNKTAEEMEAQPRPRTVNFLETRGEGGYVMAPPALGYSVHQAREIPVLSVTERAALLALCRGFSEIIKPAAPPYMPTKADSGYYDTNPFDDFNHRCNPDQLMQEMGWSRYKANNQFIWYTRPGKSHGVSMSFNLQKRFFFCFTASTDLEENKGYSPANLLAALAHHGDKKRTYADLVARGFGKIKQRVEQRLAKAAAINNKPLPPNASPEAVGLRALIQESNQDIHPHGVFWVDTQDKGMLIDRELLYHVSYNLGFCIYTTGVVRIEGRWVRMVEDREYFDTMKAYIKEDDADLHRDICNSFEAFIERHGKFTISRLAELSVEDVLRDSKDVAFKFFENGVVKITPNAITLTPYDEVSGYVWRHKVQPREFTFNHEPGGMYVDFLQKAIGISDYLRACIGYLAHDFRDSSTAYIPVLSEQCENPKDGGGAGKNIFVNLLSFTTTVTSKPGEQVKYDEKFLQSWNGERILCLSDVPKSFRYLFLKEVSSGPGILKKLHRDERTVPVEDMPKIMTTTQFSVEITDGGLKRRIRFIEFTDFFTKAGGVDEHYGCFFPDGWYPEDWQGYDNFIAQCIQQYFRIQGKLPIADISESGWQKQYDQSYGLTLAGFIRQNIEMWQRAGWVSNDDFKAALDRWYIDNNTARAYQSSMIRVNAALREWCNHHGWDLEENAQRKVNSIVVRGKRFYQPVTNKEKSNDVPF